MGFYRVLADHTDTQLARRAVAARKAVIAARNALERAESELDDCRAESDARVREYHMGDDAPCQGCSGCDTHYALTWGVTEAEDMVRHLERVDAEDRRDAAIERAERGHPIG